jgi:hypothetical protein
MELGPGTGSHPHGTIGHVLQPTTIPNRSIGWSMRPGRISADLRWLRTMKDRPLNDISPAVALAIQVELMPFIWAIPSSRPSSIPSLRTGHYSAKVAASSGFPDLAASRVRPQRRGEAAAGVDHGVAIAGSHFAMLLPSTERLGKGRSEGLTVAEILVRFALGQVLPNDHLKQRPDVFDA